MEDSHILGDDLPLPPGRLFERLAQIPGYSWDQTVEPIHSSYDNWHVTGFKYSLDSETSISSQTAASSAISKASASPRMSPTVNDELRSFRFHWRTNLSESGSELTSPREESEQLWVPVLARISSHVVRLEREFQVLRSIIDTSDPDCHHTVRPIDIIRLGSQPGDRTPLLVTIYEYLGRNHLMQFVSLGPAFFQLNEDPTVVKKVPLSTFLDFAIGACECLEVLHYGLNIIHGEIRGDAFHFNKETGRVKWSNSGNGPRSFDNALSDGWSVLSKELGVRNKLQFIAPEQTGRLPTEPDSRTDIYALGVLFWTMLAGRPAFEGNDLVEVVQNVLNKNLIPVSSLRLDIPDACSRVILKMTEKIISQRYHTISAVKWDLQQISKLLGDGDTTALKDFQIAQRDVSSFFTLPCAMFGRRLEYDRVMNVVRRVHNKRQHIAPPGKSNLYPFYAKSAGSSVSGGDRAENGDAVDTTSDSGSFVISGFKNGSPSNSLPHHNSALGSSMSVESGSSSSKAAFLQSRLKSPTDSRMSWDLVDREPSSGQFESAPAPGRRKLHSKYPHAGRCEVITLCGSNGIGKSDLIQRLLPEMRKLGYTAVAKVDRLRNVPFETFLTILASLLRQVFSERDITTEAHNAIRKAVQPIWDSLHHILGLSKQLIFPASSDGEPDLGPSDTSSVKGSKEWKQDDIGPRVPTFMSLSRGQTPDAFCQGPSSSSWIRFADIFVEILKIVSSYKTFCICVDNAQFADEESAGLMLDIVRHKIRCVLIVAGRPEEAVAPAMKDIFQSEAMNVTRVELEPLSEDDILNYVAATMHQPVNSSLVPLAAVVQEKSRGNPFYVRMILETCYRKGCIWYSWRDSAWQFDLDRFFSEFVSPTYGEGIGTEFVVKRFREIPPASRSIITWGALLGTTFSFSLVQKLLSGEFFYTAGEDDEEDASCIKRTRLIQNQSDAVAGLQFLLQSYIIIPGETDDEYRFASDHYVHAIASMQECQNREKMHFIVAQTMIKYSPANDIALHAAARHICTAANLVKERAPIRIKHRDILYEAALASYKSGAKATALGYYTQAIYLLQDNPWDRNSQDVYYEETRELYIQAAEMHLALGHTAEALDLLEVVFKNAYSPVCKARAWMVRSRVHSLIGDMPAALDDLFECLQDLGVDVREQSTWEACDEAYKTLSGYLRSIDLEKLSSRPLSEDRSLIAIGAVMSEAMAACLWLDSLTFFRLAIEMTNIYIQRGAFAQAVYLFSHLSMIATSRFKDLDLGFKLSDVAQSILDHTQEPAVLARGVAVHSSFVDHMKVPIASTLPRLENSMETAYVLGDRYVILLNVSAMALARFSLGHDFSELENFCNYSTEEIGDWANDVRGGTNIVAIRQAARALQGKTITSSPDLICSDDHHDSQQYITDLERRLPNRHSSRMYHCILFVPLYLYGHYDTVVELGTKMIESLPGLWASRLKIQAHFYLSLSILSLHLDNPNRPGLELSIQKVEEYKKVVDFARKACDANYGMWSLLLEGMLHELKKNMVGAMKALEAALDHAQLYNWPIEEGLAYELQVDLLARRGAKRAAQAMLQPAIAVWNRIGATGKAAQIVEKNEWLLRMGSISRTTDIGCQTVDSLLGVPQPRTSGPAAPHTIHSHMEDEHRQQWLEQNQEPTNDANDPLDISGVGLDILDLNSIINFSQVISSELEVENLLTKMLGIMLEVCTGSDLAFVVTEFESQNWRVAAAGDHEKGASSFANGLPFSEFEHKMAQQITHYSLRTREQVFVHNVLEDERFSNVSEAYTSQNPQGRSIIALPIVQANKLMGVLHLEGKPNSLTHRNLVVLRLLCNQIGISLTNAFLFREMRKISAANAAMVEAQKRAVTQARAAEQKAKEAEADANDVVKLKEEAAQAKSIFLANVSHDLRTPMSGVIGISEMLKKEPLTQKQDSLLDSMRVCADTLLTLINDILDFSKLEAGKMRVSIVPIDLRQTIKEVVRALDFAHQDRSIKTLQTLNIQPNLLVMSDPVRIHQILMNLISNSYKFTPKGSVTVEASLAYEDDEKVDLVCSVSDTGIGISEEQIVRLFKPFTQADSSTARAYGGSGLGLSICRSIIEQIFGGKIWLDSKKNIGTTATFTMQFKKAPRDAIPKRPFSQETVLDMKLPQNHALRDITTVPRNKIRICVAEDNPINQKIASSFVKHLGLACEVYSDGEQAVKALQQASENGNPFHIVLMDVQMPILDGYEATRRLRADPDPNVNEVLVIAMTASAIDGDREKCIEAGMNNYLAKPVRSDVLRTMLNHYLAPQPSTSATNMALSAIRSSFKAPHPSKHKTESASPPVKNLAAERDIGESSSSPISESSQPKKVEMNGTPKDKEEESKVETNEPNSSSTLNTS
ncbi:hypothetical protein FQN57_006208 [Myotisia sp. PD_48]|nr:hypothetical protein FQN57_006208 [Myotisia sp. PD_48]